MNLTLGNNVKTWNAVMFLGLAAIVAILVTDLLLPKASVTKVRSTISGKERDLTREIAANREKFETEQMTIASTTWTGSLESVSPVVLERLNQMAAAKGLQVKTFRPQRSLAEGGLDVLAFVISVEGAFPNALAFIRQIEQPGSNLAVTQIQMAAVDGASDRVSATIGVTAFAEQNKKEEANGQASSKK